METWGKHIFSMQKQWQPKENIFCSQTSIEQPSKKTNKTRKKREELSIFASKSIKKEKVLIVVEFK